MKTVPVTIGFDRTQVIGEMTIDETKLPPGAGYRFALGYRVLAFDEPALVATEIDLLQVGLVPDAKFTYVGSPRP
jgi:hypothetical protein